MPKFEKTYCSQCGGEFGPGDSGYSHCSDHQAANKPETIEGVDPWKLNAELVKALEAARPHLEGAGSPGGCDGTYNDCDHCEAIRLVDAAIAKARGKS